MTARSRKAPAPMRQRIKELRWVKPADLAPDPRNWRRHPPQQAHQLRQMLESVGIVDAAIARETENGLVLVDGHLRREVIEAEIPVLVVDLDEQEAGQVLATLDPLAGMATTDSDALQELIAQANAPVDWTALFPDVEFEPTDVLPADPDAAPEVPAEPITRRGDVWQLGRHRLMCGDATDENDVAILLQGAEPRLMVTDPPYGVNYDASWRNDELAYPATRVGKFQGDDDPRQWANALDVHPPEALYVWSPAGDQAIAFGKEIMDRRLQIRNQIIWAKQTFVISRGHYSFQHELCWYAVRKGKAAGWIGKRPQSSVWPIPWDRNTEAGHPTQKPVECMERPIRNHEGDVYDPFVGSGTTLIAAERQHRSCYAMEIDPGYVDAAVRRWEEYTGQQALRAGGTVESAQAPAPE